MDLSASLTEEQKNYDKLYTKLVAAKNNYTTKSIEAEKTLKEAELSAKNASSQYSVDVSGADNDITDAKTRCPTRRRRLRHLRQPSGMMARFMRSIRNHYRSVVRGRRYHLFRRNGCHIFQCRCGDDHRLRVGGGHHEYSCRRCCGDRAVRL